MTIIKGVLSQLCRGCADAKELAEAAAYRSQFLRTILDYNIPVLYSHCEKCNIDKKEDPFYKIRNHKDIQKILHIAERNAKKSMKIFNQNPYR
ncbi:MAG: hypothetical protein PHU12_02350 [Candidatus Aenigmarchaeota archaeon]|nr:hypothetical protein [Candidatus Aenigmarchaeota archaeon]